MAHNPKHEQLLKGVSEQFAPLLKKSTDPIYLYLDDEHKTCNEAFANMLGYASVAEWEQNPMPLDDVDKKDQKEMASSFKAAQKMECPCPEINWVTKKGKKVHSWVTLVPVPYRGETFVLHIIYPD